MTDTKTNTEKTTKKYRVTGLFEMWRNDTEIITATSEREAKQIFRSHYKNKRKVTNVVVW